MFKCVHCDKTYAYKENLTRHENCVHLKIKRFKCNNCDFTSAYKGDLKRHEDSAHLKIKRFKCNKCDYSTTRSDLLKRHNDIVHLHKKPFQCKFCSKSFAQKKGRQSHVMYKHENKSSREVEPTRYCQHNRLKCACSICDPIGHLAKNIRRGLLHGFKKLGSKKTSRTEMILGCKFKELSEHLQRKIDHWAWTYGANSGVFLTGELQIDHIRPLSTAKTPEEHCLTSLSCRIV